MTDVDDTMHPRGAGRRTRRRRGWSDERLISACLEGDVDAWTELLDRYSGLIFSIGLEVGLKREDAADLLQNVSMILLDQLGSLRSWNSLSSWIITVTRREAVRAIKRSRQHSGVQEDAERQTEPGAGEDCPDDLAVRLVALYEQQLVKEAMDRLPARCRQLLTMLFCEDPPAPYADVAARLGLSVGSVGPIRARCLDRLRRILDEMGF